MRKILVLLSLYFLIPSVFSISIGVTPGVVDLGEIERGSSKVADVFFTSRYGRDLILDLKVLRPEASFYQPTTRGYVFDSYKASEEDVSSWIRFLENPIVVSSERKTYTISGNTIVANGRATIVINVPKDAEPGYHLALISSELREIGGMTGTGVTTVTMGQPIIVFKVPGDAVRSGKILFFDSPRISETKERIDVFFQNNGSVTMTVRIDELDIYDEDGNLIANLTSYKIRVAPGATVRLPSVWDVKDVKPGYYEVKARVSWLTGEDVKEGFIQVKPFITTTTVVEVPEKREVNLLWLIIVLTIIVLVFVFMIKRRQR